jgi:hypothetical protein
VPTAHALHTAGAVAVAAAVCTVPAGHAFACRQLAWLGPEVYQPAAQAEQARSVVAVPAAATRWPAAQFAHAEQAAALAAVLNVPVAQPEHERSSVALPAAASNWPAGQTLHAVQATPLPGTENLPSEQSTAPPPSTGGRLAGLQPKTRHTNPSSNVARMKSPCSTVNGKERKTRGAARTKKRADETPLD